MRGEESNKDPDNVSESLTRLVARKESSGAQGMRKDDQTSKQKPRKVGNGSWSFEMSHRNSQTIASAP